MTLVERPAPMRSLVSAIQAAIRGRERQYQLRALLEEKQYLLDSERAARSEAERANRLKDEFLATVSHELRTPLNGILGWAQLLRQSKSPSEAALMEGLEAITRNARSQAELVEDLLDMGRIVSGKLRLDLQTVNSAAVVKAAIDTVRPSAESKAIRIEPILDLQARDRSAQWEPQALPCEVLLAGLRVLVVDDELDAREVASRVSRECQATPYAASSAREALDFMTREKIDVVLSDTGMPQEDGYWLIRQIRSLPPEKGGRVPAAALTAFARSEDRRRVLLAGYQMHLPKPIEPSELVTVVASMAGRLPSGETTPPGRK